jgi:hypothetical protein
MHKLLPEMRDAYAIELASSGDSVQTMPMARALGERARDLITGELDRLSKRIAELRDLANEPTFSSEGRNDGTIGYRGLTSPERDELKSMAQELVKIERVAQEGRRINRRLGGDGQVWDAILAEVADAKDHAQQAYDRRY